MQRFLVGSQDTSHLKIIPVLGYSKQVSDFGDELRRGNRGGNTAPREVFPLCCIPGQCSSQAMQRRLKAPAVCSNFNQRRDLATESFGRRSLPPAPIRSRRPGGQ